MDPEQTRGCYAIQGSRSGRSEQGLPRLSGQVDIESEEAQSRLLDRTRDNVQKLTLLQCKKWRPLITSRASFAPLLYQVRLAAKGPCRACLKSPPCSSYHWMSSTVSNHHHMRYQDGRAARPRLDSSESSMYSKCCTGQNKHTCTHRKYQEINISQAASMQHSLGLSLSTAYHIA